MLEYHSKGDYMYKINLTSINMNYSDQFKSSFALVKKCEYDNNLYIYKKFSNVIYFKKIVPKFEKIFNLNSNSIILPKILVYDNTLEEYNAYLTDYCDYENGLLLKTIDNKIERLFEIKNNIDNMHNIGIIHGDLHFGNILINKDYISSKIIDFDNCAYEKFKINKSLTNDYTKEYIQKYGINKGLDIFLFNIMTYCVLNSSPYFQTRIRINNGMYGIFNTASGKKICDNLLLENKTFDNEYLIDTCYKYLRQK